MEKEFNSWKFWFFGDYDEEESENQEIEE